MTAQVSFNCMKNVRLLLQNNPDNYEHRRHGIMTIPTWRFLFSIMSGLWSADVLCTWGGMEEYFSAVFSGVSVL